MTAGAEYCRTVLYAASGKFGKVRDGVTSLEYREEFGVPGLGTVTVSLAPVVIYLGGMR